MLRGSHHGSSRDDLRDDLGLRDGGGGLPADFEVLLVRSDLPSRNPAAADLARHVLTPRAQLRAQTEGKAPERAGGL